MRDWEVWEQWSDDRFFMEMLRIHTKESAIAKHESTYLQTLNRLSQEELVIDFRIEDSEIPYVSKIKKILRETQFVHTITEDELSSAITKLIKQIGEGAAKRENSLILRELQDYLKAARCTSIGMMLDLIGTFVQQRREIWRAAVKYGWHPKYWASAASKRTDTEGEQQKKLSDRGSGGSFKKREDKTPKNPTSMNSVPANPNAGQLCQGCGRKNHTRETCDRKQHPDYNHIGDWSDSETLRKLKANNVVDRQGVVYTVLPYGKRADGTPYNPPEPPRGPKPLGKRKTGEEPPGCHDCNECHECKTSAWECVNVLNTSYDDSHAVPVSIHVYDHHLTLNVLLDTGALQGNYVSKRTAEWLRTNGATMSEEPCRICSAFNDCVLIKNKFNFNISFKQVASIHTLHENASYGVE